MQRYGSIAISGAVVMALAGCAPSLKEPPRTADVAVPAKFTAAEAGGEYAYADTAWVESFSSPTLSALVSEALEHNRDLRVASARVQQARARARIVGADLWPQLGVGVEATQMRTGLRSGGDSDAAYGVGLNVSWEADLWGRLASEKREATLTAQGSAYDYAAARLSLAGQVAEAWFSAIVARQQLELATATVDTFERSERIVRERHQAGLASELDLHLAISNHQSALALARLRDQQFSEARRQLEVLLGRYPASAVSAGEALPTLPTTPAAGVPTDVLARRPDLQADFSRLIASRYNVSAARRALLPSLKLTGSLGDSGASIADAFDFKQIVASIVGNLTQPLFQGGRLRANVDLAKATENEAVQTYAQSVLRAMQEVENGLGAEAQLQAREAALTEAARQAAAAERLAEVQYTNGLTSILTLLDAQRRNLDAQSQLLEVRLVRMISRVRLHVALGGSMQPAAANGQG